MGQRGVALLQMRLHSHTLCIWCLYYYVLVAHIVGCVNECLDLREAEQPEQQMRGVTGSGIVQHSVTPGVHHSRHTTPTLLIEIPVSV